MASHSLKYLLPWSLQKKKKKKHLVSSVLGFPGSSAGKESTCNAGDPGSIPGLGRSPGKGIGYPLQHSWASLVAQLVKNPPEMRDLLGSITGLGRFPGEGTGYPLTSGILRTRWCYWHSLERTDEP